MEITPVMNFNGWTAKREDYAAYTGPDFPSGSKVRQFLEMAKKSPGAPMIVGCSAHSAMQIYIAASAKAAGVPGIVYTAARKERTDATKYAARMGAEIVEVRPAYLSVCRARARSRAKLLGQVVRWNPQEAVRDTIAQCVNIPPDTKRVVVPTGSGLTAIGVLVGLAEANLTATVLAVAVSTMASKQQIYNDARMFTIKKLPKFEMVRAAVKYENWVKARLPDDTLLDPYYAAKAVGVIVDGDCLWIPGVRPISAMPRECRV